ncbi:hypothetical protein MMC22_006059 [Lobaria immixta]|nr:hypothetical protein [Lobaria immixta]
MASNMDLLPEEVLLEIFASLNKQDLAAVRLTSKHLDEVASQIYLDSITISLRRQTLVDLDTITRHPVLRKGVRRVYFDISQYDDRATRKEVYTERLLRKLENELGSYLSNACSHHRSKPLVRIFRKHTCKKGVLCDPERISDLQDWIKLCEELRTGWAADRLWPIRKASSIINGYSRYCELATDQKLLSQSETHVRLFERALENMPRVKSLWVVDLSNAILRSSVTFDNRNGHRAFCLDRTLVSNPHHMAAFRLDKILLAWEKLGLRLEDFNCRNTGALLQMLPARLIYPPTTTSVLKHLVKLEIKFNFDDIDFGNEHGEGGKISSGAFDLMLSQAEGLQSLTIDGGANLRSRYILFMDHTSTPVWKNIKHITLKRMTINFEEFMTYCVLQTTLVSLAFDGVVMVLGTWKDALEIFRITLQLRQIRFNGVYDCDDGCRGFTHAEEDVMALYALNREADLIRLLR